MYQRYLLRPVNGINPRTSYYSLLASTPNDSFKFIRSQYSKIKLLIRPDDEDDKSYTKQWSVLNEIIEVISTKQSRAQYRLVHHLSEYIECSNPAVSFVIRLF